MKLKLIPDWMRFRRKESKATDINTLLHRLALRNNTNSGVAINEETALQSPTFYAAVTAISRTIAQLPLDVVRTNADGSHEKLKTHNLYQLLNLRPNEWQSRFEYWNTVGTHMLMHNVFYAYKNQAPNGRIINLHPLHPSCVEPIQREDMRLEYRVTFGEGSHRRQEVVPSSKIHRIMLMSTDGIRPVSPIDKLKETIALEIAAEKFGANIFKNGAIPNLILKHPGTFKDNETYERFRTSWQEAHGKGGTAILEEGMEVDKISHTADESQFLETRKLVRSVIAGAMNISPHRVADMGRMTFNNVEQLSLEYVNYTIMPLLLAIETAASRDLIPDNQQASVYLKFNVNGLLRGDSKARAEQLQIWRLNGIISADEWRALEDMNPLPDGQGQQYITPMNYSDGTDAPSAPDDAPDAPDDDPDES